MIDKSMLPQRQCLLPECPNIIPQTARITTRFCCHAHRRKGYRLGITPSTYPPLTEEQCLPGKRKLCSCGAIIDSRSSTCKPCMGIKNRGKSARGGWKEKSTPYTKTTPQGYVLVYIPVDGTPRGGTWQCEHRLVVEESLGRKLCADEYVHHINGVRNDNRLENLELWVKSQPKGTRVEDAIKWAQTILDRYQSEDK